MADLAPLMRDQRKVDADQLKLLATLHYVLGGLSVLGLGLLFAHWLLMHKMLDDPSIWAGQRGAPSPHEFYATFRWFYAVCGAVIILTGAANAASGALIRRRRGRVFSIVVAAANCMFLPGVLLGVFTFVVLLRDSVAEVYRAAAASTASTTTQDNV